MEIQQQESFREELGVFLEHHYQVPPLAGRIYATLILSASLGVTFDTLVEELKASKSSISTNLKLLQNLEMINYFTKCGDRKKYFKTDENHMVKSLEKRIENWETEKLMHRKIYAHKKKVLGQSNKSIAVNVGLRYNELYLEYADGIQQQLEEIKCKLSKEINENQ